MPPSHSQVGAIIVKRMAKGYILLVTIFSIIVAAATLPDFGSGDSSTTSTTIHRSLRTEPQTSKDSTTIVFAYFEIENSKHKISDYLQWMRLAMCIEDPVVLFVSPHLVPHFKELRSHALDRTLLVPMDVSEIHVGNNLQLDDAFWEEQKKYDPKGNSKGHPGDSTLYKIWLGKSWLVNQAIQLNPFHSQKYVYIDMGHFRDTKTFCGHTVVQHPEIIPDDRIVLFPYRALSVEWKDIDRDQNPLWSEGFWSHYIAGSVISGGVTAWPKFMNKMEETIRIYADSGLGLFDDQIVMQSTCMRNPGLCVVVRWDAPFGEGNGDCRIGYPEACMDHGGWTSSSYHGFVSGKYRLWHGGNMNTMYWDPGLGTPTQDEDPGLYPPTPA
jgi:hypothetical protein